MARHCDTNSDREDIRVSATSKIWAFATGMLAICIPLADETDSGPLLPLAVISGAAIATSAVWQPSNKKFRNNALQATQVEALEERIANLETIVSSDELNLQGRIQRLEMSDKIKEL
ncbi:MAG: hypothetical protein KME06_12170 [Kastovskya adunca ATA6-11-RM4]|nr:hypothetical protein [Kastovskya adunca ATA6-11-RM4]